MQPPRRRPASRAPAPPGQTRRAIQRPRGATRQGQRGGVRAPRAAAPSGPGAPELAAGLARPGRRPAQLLPAASSGPTQPIQPAGVGAVGVAGRLDAVSSCKASGNHCSQRGCNAGAGAAGACRAVPRGADAALAGRRASRASATMATTPATPASARRACVLREDSRSPSWWPWRSRRASRSITRNSAAAICASRSSGRTPGSRAAGGDGMGGWGMEWGAGAALIGPPRVPRPGRVRPRALASAGARWPAAPAAARSSRPG